MPLESGSTLRRKACWCMALAASGVGVVTTSAWPMTLPMSFQEIRPMMSLNHCGNGRKGFRFSGMKWLVATIRMPRFTAS